MALLEVSGIRKKLHDNVVIDNISFTQKKLEKIAIAGETGSGKSTLLKIVAGLVQPDSGKILFDNDEVKGPDHKLVPGHPGIAYLAQNYALPKNLRVEQVLAYANNLSDVNADLIYSICRIDHLLSRKTNEVSGGEQQRIAIARLLTGSPQMLLLDEPFSNLDMVMKNELKLVINDIARQLKITITLVSHDPMDSLSWADKVLVLRNGALVQKGSPQHIYGKPIDAYVAGLFGKYNLIPGEHSLEFCQRLGITPVKKDLIFRPEDFLLSTKGPKKHGATVKHLRFYGGFYEAEVDFAGHLLTVRTDSDHFTRGQQVFLKPASTPKL